MSFFRSRVILDGMTETQSYERAGEIWLSPSEAGELVPGGVTAVTVRKWCRLGRVPGAVQLPSGRWKVPASAIDAMISDFTAVAEEDV